MFWGKKNTSKSDKRNKKSCVGREGQPLSREEIQAQALANARAAREQIGEDTIQKIAAAMTKKQQSAVEQAKRKIEGADLDRVLDELKFMMDEKKK